MRPKLCHVWISAKIMRANIFAYGAAHHSCLQLQHQILPHNPVEQGSRMERMESQEPQPLWYIHSLFTMILVSNKLKILFKWRKKIICQTLSYKWQAKPKYSSFSFPFLPHLHDSCKCRHLIAQIMTATRCSKPCTFHRQAAAFICYNPAQCLTQLQTNNNTF